LRGREALGDVDGHLGHAQVQRGLVPRVPDDDDAVLVHANRLAKSELLDRRVIDARVVVVRPDRLDRSHLAVHATPSVCANMSLYSPPTPFGRDMSHENAHYFSAPNSAPAEVRQFRSKTL